MTRLEYQPCEICGGREVVLIGRPTVARTIPTLLPRYEEVRVVRCRRCGFYFANPMPHFADQHFQILYSEEYFAGRSHRPARWDDMRRFGNPNRRLNRLEALARRPLVDFLEVGCGEGLAMERARERGWRVVGQDRSRALAAEVERRLGAPVIIEPLESRPFGEQCFDAVYLDSVLEHVPHPRRLLEEIRLILRPLGVAYLILPNESSLFNALRRARHLALRTGRTPQLSPLTLPYHLVGFSPSTLSRLARSVGFRVAYCAALDGTGERHKFTHQHFRGYLTHIAFFPFYWLGERLGCGITIEAVLEA
jgi:SAM-dependent methyltransferase